VFTATGFSVQIVQVIPRRGVNFFDRNDPTGQATVLVAQAGLSAPVTQVFTGGGGAVPSGASCPAPTGAPEVCGATLSIASDGFPNVAGPGFGRIFWTPSGASQITADLLAGGGVLPNTACPGLICTAVQTFTPGGACDVVSYMDASFAPGPRRFAIKLRRNGAQVCAQRLLPMPGCDASGVCLLP
jgi:hypothetical protein